MGNLRKAKGLWFVLVLALPAGNLRPVRGGLSYIRRRFTSLRGLSGRARVFRLLASISITAMMLVFALPSTFAQATTGGIGGVVTDTQGGVIAGAEVTASENATGVQTKVVTNGDGVYSLPQLKPGMYTLSVSKQGFKTQQFQEVTVTIAQTVTLDAVLQTGQPSESITVSAGGEAELNREEAQISNTFESKDVEDLPSNGAGQGIDTLALLLPGVIPGVGNVNGNGTTLSVNGNRARSNNFTIDGGDNNDLSIGGPSFFVDNPDTVAQFQVITNNFDAEYGRNEGAVVNIVTKAGTNHFHGDAAWFHRDASFLNSLDNIEKAEGLTGPPPAIYNLWDGVLGGPIIKNKLFFFGSFQYITQPSTVLLNSGLPSILPSAFPALNAAFPNNPLIQAIIHDSAYAFPNFGTLSTRTDLPTGTINIGGTNYPIGFPSRLVSEPFNEKEFSVRGDWKITDNHALWFRQYYQLEPGQNALASVNGFVGSIPARGNLSTASYTWQVSPTAVNNFEFVRNRLFVLFGGGCTGANCIPAPTDILDSFTNISFTGTTTSVGLPLLGIGPSVNLPQGRTVTTFQFRDDFSKVVGRHELKMGADVRRLNNSVPFLPNANGAFTFGSNAAIASNTASATNLAVGPAQLTYNETDTYFYFQDNWKIRDNLTLNLGLRWEYSGQPLDHIHDVDVAQESNPATALWLQSLPLSDRVFPKIPSDKHEFAPRLGFAWTPRFGDNRIMKSLFGDQDKTVISGGYSIAYDPSFYNILLNITTSAPTVFTTNTPFGLPFANANGATLDAFARSNNLTQANTFDPRFFPQSTVAPNFYNPMSQQVSLRVQREFTRNQIITLAYVYTHGTGLFANVNANPYVASLINGFSAGGFTFPGFPGLAPPGIRPVSASACPGIADNNNACAGRLLDEGIVLSRDNTAVSTYNAFQFHYQARVRNQLSLGVSYTFSKALDNASEIFGFTEPEVPQDPFNRKLDRGYSTFNRPNVFAMNFVWDIPAFKEQRGVFGHVLGGWQFNGVYNLASGQDFTPTQITNLEVASGLGNLGASYDDIGFDFAQVGSDSLRPFIGSLKAPATQIGIDSVDAALLGLVPATTHVAPNIIFSYNALNNTHSIVVVNPNQVRFIANGPGAAQFFGTPFGTAQRGMLQGPLLNNLNLGFFKNIRLRESVTMQLRLEAFNALNHPNPAVGFNAQTNISGTLPIPNNVIDQAGNTAASFGQYSGIEESAREVQVGIKVIF